MPLADWPHAVPSEGEGVGMWDLDTVDVDDVDIAAVMEALRVVVAVRIRDGDLELVRLLVKDLEPVVVFVPDTTPVPVHVPYAAWHPVPQKALVVPHQPYCEQQSPAFLQPPLVPPHFCAKLVATIAQSTMKVRRLVLMV